MTAQSYAQELIICKKHDTNGNPKDIRTEWKMTTPPLRIVFIYNNGKTTIDNRIINFIFTPTSGQNIKPDTVKVAIGQSRNWLSTKYAFQVPGGYKVKVMIPNGKVLATGKLNIEGTPKPIAIAPKKPIKKEEVEPEVKKKPKKEKKKEEPAKVEAPPQTTKPSTKVEEESTSLRIYPDVSKMGTLGASLTNSLQGIELIEDAETDKYFEHLYVGFGRSVEFGMLTGQNEKFKLKYGGTLIECLFTHTKELDCDWIGVSIWYKPRGAKDFTEHIEEQRLNINPTDHSSRFSTTYKKKGAYRITLYTDDLKKIGYAYVNFY